MAIQCPKCGMKVSNLYRCDFCGDVRCDSSVSSGTNGGCNSSKSPYGRPQGAANGRTCFACKKGKYQKI